MFISSHICMRLSRGCMAWHCRTETPQGDYTFLDRCDLTIVWDDGPGHRSSVNTTEHPKHAQPAQVLSALLLGQELRIIGKYDGNGASDTAQ